MNSPVHPSSIPDDVSHEAPFAMSIENAVAFSGLSRATLYRLAARGLLRPRKLGKRTLILRHELARFLAELPIMER